LTSLFIELIDRIAVGVDRMQRNFEPIPLIATRQPYHGSSAIDPRGHAAKGDTQTADNAEIASEVRRDSNPSRRVLVLACPDANCSGPDSVL
jgi:hypothetical protein